MVPQHPPTTSTPRSVTKRAVVLGQRVGGEVVVHVAVDHRRQPGVGDARDGHAGVLGQVAQVLAHLDRAGGAVDADDVGPHGVEGGTGRRRSRCRAACARSAPWSPAPGAGPRGRRRPWPGGQPIMAALMRQQVEEGLDDEEVDAAVEQAPGLDLVAGRAGRRSGSGPATGTWCPGRSSRPRTGAGRAWRSSSATSRAMRAPARLISWARSARPYSPRVAGRPPKV